VIFGNAIFGNRGLGINLQPAGEPDAVATPNDPEDSDLGPNNLQNHPELSEAMYDGISFTVIRGSLQSAAGRAYAVDVYSNRSIDPSGFGEGETWLGSVSFETDTNGLGTFEFEAAGSLSNRFFTATALDLVTGDTSEFSPWIPFPGATRITSVQIVGRDARVTFTSEREVSYGLERSALPAPTGWEPVPGAEDIPGTGGLLTATDANVLPTLRSAYYRVRRIAPGP
jgi:hypothetical protein